MIGKWILSLHSLDINLYVGRVNHHYFR